MRPKTKIAAFTLNELLVVLLMTTIILGMAFSVLSLVRRQMHGIGQNFEKNTELNLLRRSLWIDFNQADGAWYDAETRELVFANALRERTYQIEGDYLIKAQDTFHIRLDDMTFFFKGDRQETGEIDALDFVTDQRHGGQHLFIKKKNAATSEMND